MRPKYAILENTVIDNDKFEALPWWKLFLTNSGEEYVVYAGPYVSEVYAALSGPYLEAEKQRALRIIEEAQRSEAHVEN